MAFKEVADLSAETTIALGGTNRKTGKPNPTKIEGYYLGSRTVEDRKKKSGQSYIYIFQTAKGNVGVWGKTDLDRKMTTATPGVMMRVTSTGTVPTPNGDMYKYKVEFDPENTIEVVGGGSELSASGSEETGDGGWNAGGGDEDSGYSQGGDEDNGDDAEGVAYAAAAAAAAERKAKVQALLKKNK